VVKIIAELGSNPAAGGWQLACYCDAAAMAGADAVKVQLFRAEHFPEAEWESKRVLEFPRERLAEFVDYAHVAGLEAGASVFDAGAVQAAAKHCDWLKLAARERTNIQLRGLTVTTRKVVYRSISSFHNFLVTGREVPMVTIQQYPAPMWKALLAAVGAADYFRKHGVKMWGWSSHTRGWLDCALAARLGASVIEKHFCLSHDEIEGGHSLTPDEFARMVNQCRKYS